MSTNLPWAGLVRVSNMGARKPGAENVHTDREQVEDIERGVPKGERLVLLPPELDVSGGRKLEDRPSLLTAVEGVERGQYAGVIVSHLSRLGRNVREQLRAWDRIEAAGGRVIVVREGIDTSTPHGRMVRTIMLAVAEGERETHLERFELRRRVATAAGVWQRRQTPRGYGKDPLTRRLVPDERADEVRSAFRDHAAGVPLIVLARRLGMSPAGVRYMLRNRVYRGELHVGPDSNLTAHEAIVTEDEWLAAQASVTTRPARSGEDVALLAGILRCAGCGHIMSRNNQLRHGGKRVVTYNCHGRMAGGPCRAPASIVARNVDDYVERLALQRLVELHAAAVEEHGLETELETFLLAVSAADVGATAFGAAVRARKQRLEDKRAELSALLARGSHMPAGDPLSFWPMLNADHRNRVLRSLLEAVLVRRAGGAGARMALAERVRVVRYGSGLVDAIASVRGDVARPCEPIAFPASDDPAVLREPLAEHLLERARG
jgi:DNA invertase Pin-like site-specific DNA recombinase